MAETLRPVKDPKWQTTGNRTRVPLNQRFVWENVKRKRLFNVTERVERIIDTMTGEVLAQYVDFGTHWFRIRSCERDGHKVNRVDFYKFKHLLQEQGE